LGDIAEVENLVVMVGALVVVFVALIVVVVQVDDASFVAAH
jgi:hypothetical protein